MLWQHMNNRFIMLFDKVEICWFLPGFFLTVCRIRIFDILIVGHINHATCIHSIFSVAYLGLRLGPSLEKRWTRSCVWWFGVCPTLQERTTTSGRRVHSAPSELQCVVFGWLVGLLHPELVLTLPSSCNAFIIRELVLIFVFSKGLVSIA